MKPGLYHDVPMAQYLQIDALGSSRMEWLTISPLHYKHMLTQPPEDTEATRRGTALHMALLQPDLFASKYAPEPDPAVCAPDNAKPRATKAYKDAVAFLEEHGATVLRADEWERVAGMAAAIAAHPQSRRLLARAPEREVSAVWDRRGRLCRGRFDLLGDGILADVKTTRSLIDFSPWTITKRGYHRQLAHFRDGAKAHGIDVRAAFLVAVESTAPFDVGVFVLDDSMLEIGEQENAYLIRKLDACELSGDWPGMFPDLVQAELTDAAALSVAGLED